MSLIPARLVKGTKEEVEVTVVDNTNQLTDLTGHSPTFTVKDAPGGSSIQSGSATVSAMTMHCLIDTTGAGYVVETTVYLYVSFTDGSQVPVLGPFPIAIGS